MEALYPTIAQYADLPTLVCMNISSSALYGAILRRLKHAKQHAVAHSKLLECLPLIRTFLINPEERNPAVRLMVRRDGRLRVNYKSSTLNGALNTRSCAVTMLAGARKRFTLGPEAPGPKDALAGLYSPTTRDMQLVTVCLFDTHRAVSLITIIEALMDRSDVARYYDQQ
jgi:hypothetical protein